MSLESIKIGTRIWIAALALMVALFAASSFIAFEKYQEASELGALEELGSFAPTISALVHELQKERGASAGFIAQKGTGPFAKRLPAQRSQTDDRLAQFTAELERRGLDDFGPGLVGKRNSALEALSALEATRGSVADLKYSVGQMAQYYTGAIRKLLSIVEQMTLISRNATVTQRISAYTAILQGKERAGVERAMGANGFGAGEFRPATYQKFVSLISIQNIYFDRVFPIYATPDQASYLRNTVTGPVVAEVERMRKIAKNAPFSGTTEGIEGSHWFDQITKKIDLLKTVEDKVSSDLVTTLRDIKSSANFHFLVTLALSLAIITIVGGFVAYIIKPTFPR